MIFTSYFSKYTGPLGVSVANSHSKGYECEEVKALRPDWVKVQQYKAGEITWKEFRRAYISKLKKLDVSKYYRMLNGKVILCWEKGGNCHRHIIKEWMNRNGYSCEELEAESTMGTCAYCKKLSAHSNTNIFCTVTGEIMTQAQANSHTCDDWRYTL